MYLDKCKQDIIHMVFEDAKGPSADTEKLI